MRYLLDTDTTSYLMKRKHPNHVKVLKRLLSISPTKVVISSITVSELASGLYQIPPDRAVYRQELKKALEYFFTSIIVLDFTMTSSWVYGKIRASLKQAGQDVGAMDCLIAAHALVENRILVTNNQEHFSRILDLKTENWTV